MTDQSGAPNRRNINLTLLVLIGLIGLGVVIGILSILWGGPVQPPPEDSTTGPAMAALSLFINAGAVL
jgi:hypothetical protein